MNLNEVPIPLEKTVIINGSTIEVSIAETKMTDGEKDVYKKFMAKCMTETKGKTQKDAAMSCAVSFKSKKDELMKQAEDAKMSDVKKEAMKEESQEEKDEEGKTDKEKLALEKQDIKDDLQYLKELEKKIKKSDAATKNQGKMQYRDKPKTPANSVGIITVEQINKFEKAEKGENQLSEDKETKKTWKNTIDL
jgi:hypothetical protein